MEIDTYWIILPVFCSVTQDLKDFPRGNVTQFVLITFYILSVIGHAGNYCVQSNNCTADASKMRWT